MILARSMHSTKRSIHYNKDFEKRTHRKVYKKSPIIDEEKLIDNWVLFWVFVLFIGYLSQALSEFLQEAMPALCIF